MKKITLVCVLLGSVARSALAFEATVITNPGEVNQLNGPWTLGYTFTPNIDLTVTALGSFAPVVAYARTVGIWDSAGTLLMTASVDGSEAVVNYMNYTSAFTTLTSSGSKLDAGQVYTVGATVLNGDGNWALNPTFSVDSNISFGQSRFVAGSALNFPNSYDPTKVYFGGSFQAEPFGGPPQPVPEPCTVLAIGLSAAAYTRKKLRV